MSDNEDYFSDNNISDTESLIEKQSSIKNKNTTANDIISDDEDNSIKELSDTEQDDADHDGDDDDNDENSVVIEGSDDDDNDPDSDFEDNDNNDVSASANTSTNANKKKSQSQKYASNFDSLQPGEYYNENLDNFKSDDEDDNLSDDCEYLDLLENNINSNYLEENHPECISHNYHEIQTHLTITKDDYGNIIDPLHKTSPILTKYEKTRIIGQRAKQISDGSKPYIHLSHTIIEPHIIAEMELQEKKLPFIIKRPIPNGGFEYWRLRDLDIIAF